MMWTTWCRTDIEWAISDQLRSPLRHRRQKQQIVNIETEELTPTFPRQTSKIPILSLPASQPSAKSLSNSMGGSAVTYWLHYVLQNENEIRQYR